MIVARWEIKARFGHKQEAIRLMKQWDAEIGRQIGMGGGRMLTGSVGDESIICQELELASLTELDELWRKLASVKMHPEWGKEMEKHVVSGSNRWTVLRVVD